MADAFKVHRAWEDWIVVAIGVLIGASPWLAGQSDDQALNWSVVVLGAVVVTLGVLELTALQRWEEAVTMLCGFWLLALPFAFGYVESTLGRSHLGLGVLLVMLAVLELWQDWHRSDDEMARSAPPDGLSRFQ